MASKLETLTAEIQQMRGKAKAIFDRYKAAGKTYEDFTDEDANTIAGLNKELDTKVAECDRLQKLDKFARDTEAALAGTDGAFNPTAPAHSGKAEGNEPGGAGTPVNTKDAEDEAIREAGGVPARVGKASLVDLFMKSPAFSQFRRAERKSPTVDVSFKDGVPPELVRKALVSTVQFVPATTRSDLILPALLRRPVVADLIPQGTIGQTEFRYMEETVATNNAAAVLEAGQKPESAVSFDEASAPVRKIATVIPVTEELFEDAPSMRTYLEARLGTFLQLAEENQLVGGSGVAPQLMGLLNVTGLQTQPRGLDNIPDAIYKAFNLIQVNSLLSPSGVIMHPFDWQDVRLMKTDTGIYIFGSPMEGDTERIFGYPVIKTTAIAENTALAGAFDTGVLILRRSGVSFAVSDQHADFFIFNKLMLRIEERLAFPILRPQAFCQITGV